MSYRHTSHILGHSKGVPKLSHNPRSQEVPWMAPTVPPPPSTENLDAVPTTAAPLEDVINRLHDLIYSVTLPKTKTAKTAVITIEALHTARSLAASAQVSLLAHKENTALSKVSMQLDAIAAHLAISAVPPSDQKRSYATVLTSGIHPLRTASAASAASATSTSTSTSIDDTPSLPPLPLPHPRPCPHPCPHPRPHPATRFDMTLTLKSRDSPISTDWSNEDLIGKILVAMRDTNCWMEERTCSPDSEGNPRPGLHPPRIRAVGQYRSGDFWVATDTKEGRDMMIATVNTWLPKLSDRLKYVQKTYPVIVYGVPTACVSPASDTDEDLAALIVEHNSDILVRPEALTRAEFLAPGHGQTGRRQAPRGAKISLVLHLADPAVANKCIDRHIVLFGGLFPTAKFVPHPPRCYNCQITGHLARSCKMPTRCGLCAENHDTQQCRNMRKNSPLDQLPPLKCVGCQGPHAASDTSCPARRMAIQAHRRKITVTDFYFPVQSQHETAIHSSPPLPFVSTCPQALHPHASAAGTTG